MASKEACLQRQRRFSRRWHCLNGTSTSRLANAGVIMKVGIISTGRVGCACALAAVLVDRTRKRAKAVATDLRYGSLLCPKTTIVDGDYDDLADAALVMITAGINEKAGGATDRGDPGADCGCWARTPRSIATSFRVSCARRLTCRHIGRNRPP